MALRTGKLQDHKPQLVEHINLCARSLPALSIRRMASQGVSQDYSQGAAPVTFRRGYLIYFPDWLKATVLTAQ